MLQTFQMYHFLLHPTFIKWAVSLVAKHFKRSNFWVTSLADVPYPNKRLLLTFWGKSWNGKNSLYYFIYLTSNISTRSMTFRVFLKSFLHQSQSANTYVSVYLLARANHRMDFMQWISISLRLLSELTSKVRQIWGRITQEWGDAMPVHNRIFALLRVKSPCIVAFVG